MTDHHPSLIVGPYPGPRHGMALVTDAVANQLEPDVDRIDTSADVLGGGLLSNVTKLARMAGAVLAVARMARRAPAIMIAVDSGEGMYFNAAMVIAARLARTPVVLQHHTEAYLDQPRRTMQVIQRIGGSFVTNALLCPKTAQRFADAYGLAPDRVTALGNAYSVPPTPLTLRPDRPVTIGHLANLSEAKGILDVVRLARSQPDTTILVAGPAVDQVATDALAELEGMANVTLLGQLDAAGVAEFHQRCDIFLMPSKTEAMPLVVWEALGAGAVVLSYDIGCISSMASAPSLRLAATADDLEALLESEVAAARNRTPHDWCEIRSRSSEAFEHQRVAQGRGVSELLRKVRRG